MQHFKLHTFTSSDKALLTVSNKNRVEERRLVQKLAGFEKSEKLLRREITKIREARTTLKRDIAQLQTQSAENLQEGSTKMDFERRRASTGSCNAVALSRKSLSNLLEAAENEDTVSALQGFETPRPSRAGRRFSMPAIPVHDGCLLPPLEQQRHVIERKPPQTAPIFTKNDIYDKKEAITDYGRSMSTNSLDEAEKQHQFSRCSRYGRRASAPVIFATPPPQQSIRYSLKATQDFISEERIKSQFRRIGQVAIGAAILRRGHAAKS